MNIKKGDNVYIIAGREKGKQGAVEKTYPEANKLVITGVNIRKRHLKPSRTHGKGGIIEYPGPLTRANVMVICPHCAKTTRIKSTVGADNKKYRHCMHCQGSLDTK